MKKIDEHARVTYLFCSKNSKQISHWEMEISRLPVKQSDLTNKKGRKKMEKRSKMQIKKSAKSTCVSVRECE